MSTMLEWAKYYRDTMGWSVIPIVKGAKNPSIPWTEYQTRKATDEELNKWFKNDNANIGVVTGKISNIAVVDIDTEEGMQEITKYIPDSTITPTVSTPKGGQHLYFTMPDIDLRNNTRAVPGCDLRAEGGYVVAPPSINGNGKAYHWVIDTNTSISYLNHAYIYYILASTTFSMSPTRFDGQSDHKVTTNRPQSDHTDHNFSDRPQLTTKSPKMFIEGRRDNDLFHTANSLVKSGMPIHEVEEVLYRLAISCDPPFPIADIPAKIQSALQRADRRDRNISEEVREFVANTTGVFETRDIYQALTLNSREEKKAVVMILSRLFESSEIERVGGRNGVYRKIQNDDEDMELFSDPGKEFDIKLPLGLNSLVKIYPMNIIVVAGSKSSGKTAMLLNIAHMNMGRYPIVYLNSEMGPIELSERLDNFGEARHFWTDKEKFRAVSRHNNFQDKITAEPKIYIIDFLECHDNFYEIAKPIRLIHEKLQDGVCVIAIQKGMNDQLGRGKDFSMEKARLYLTLDYLPTERCSKCTIVDAKTPRHNENLRYRYRTYKLGHGSSFYDLSDWRE